MNIQEATRLLVLGDHTQAELVEQVLLEAGDGANAVLRLDPTGPGFIVTAVGTRRPASVATTAANLFPGFELTGKQSVGRRDSGVGHTARLFVYRYEPVKVPA
ncbi:MAG: hypothetical protein M3Q75_00835 [Gemmatimonadota bacterium]|nr:hypothetical protein [Gemmatimonadota bacterium]